MDLKPACSCNDTFQGLRWQALIYLHALSVGSFAQDEESKAPVMQGLLNFKPSVRPVPLECHIQGYPGKFYCPRMATMNKPAYAAIQV